VAAIDALHGAMSWSLFGHIVWLGFLTMLRVLAMTVIATLIWTPVGSGSAPSRTSPASPSRWRRSVRPSRST
jgi:NitT/TauT family transport system permease protein